MNYRQLAAGLEIVSPTMSASATPILPERFAEAIVGLPLAELHFKAAEIRNSISHLESSNGQLQPFAEEGDSICTDAIRENNQTIKRMEERILLLRRETERRGYQWGEDIDLRVSDVQARTNGNKESETEIENTEHNLYFASSDASTDHHPRSANGPRGDPGGDEQLASTARDRMDNDEDENNDQDGVHL